MAKEAYSRTRPAKRDDYWWRSLNPDTPWTVTSSAEQEEEEGNENEAGSSMTYEEFFAIVEGGKSGSNVIDLDAGESYIFVAPVGGEASSLPPPSSGPTPSTTAEPVRASLSSLEATCDAVDPGVPAPPLTSMPPSSLRQVVEMSSLHLELIVLPPPPMSSSPQCR